MLFAYPAKTVSDTVEKVLADDGIGEFNAKTANVDVFSAFDGFKLPF